MEYPGYGIYTGTEANEEQIYSDAETIYKYVTTTLRKKESDIIIFGRL